MTGGPGEDRARGNASPSWGASARTATGSALRDVDFVSYGEFGRQFFTEVAPCTKVQEFHGRFVEGVRNRNLHTVFDYEFRFRDGRRKNVVISMFYSASTETVWVLVERP